MKLKEGFCLRLFSTGDKVAKSAPEIAPEIRGAISIVQNPGTDLTATQVEHSLREIMRICDERRAYLSPVNTDRLYEFFNMLSGECGLPHRINRIGWTTVAIGRDGTGISIKGLMSQLEA